MKKYCLGYPWKKVIQLLECTIPAAAFAALSSPSQKIWTLSPLPVSLKYDSTGFV